MKSFFYLVALATIMMTSCSNNEEKIKKNGAEDLKIKFGSTTGHIDVTTKVPVNDGDAISDIQLIRIDDHLISQENWTTARLATSAFTTASSDGTLTVVTPQYYNAKPDMYSTLTAYAPATGATFVVSTPVTATWTIDGKTDILVSSSTVSGTKTNGSTTVLNFPLEHKLLQFRFYLAADGTAAQSSWGSVTNIEILNSPKSAIATFPVVTMDFPNSTSSDQTEIPVYVNATDTKLSESEPLALTLTENLETPTLSNNHAYVMVAPNTVNANKQFGIKVYTENNSAGTELTVELNNEPVAGESYAVTLTFKATTIDFSATLANWVTSEKTGTGTVE